MAFNNDFVFSINNRKEITMNINTTNNMSAILNSYMKNSKNTANSVSFAGKLQETKQVQKKDDVQVKEKTESAVSEYKRKHPDDTYNVDRQVNAGKAVLAKNGADKVSRDDMTMEEYKSFITDLMNNIPFDASQRNCTEIWNISEKGWEQMKNDPDYEAWVLGYTSLNRAVHLPFGLSGSGNLCTENFGASIEEHIGQSVPQGGFGSKASKKSDNEESWWEKRHKLYEKMMKEQMEKSIKNAQARRISEQKQYYEQALAENKGLIQPLGGEHQILQALTAYQSNFLIQ